MVFNKETKQAFVHPPKTGTHSIQAFLKSCGWKQLPMTHARTARLLHDYPNLNDYLIYGFLRDPLLRFESVILHLKRMQIVDDVFKKVLQDNAITKPVELVSYEDVIDIFPQLSVALPAFCHSQSQWLNHPKVTVLDFRNIESELRRISGNNQLPIPKENESTGFGKSEITSKVIEFVRHQYEDDYNLALNRGIVF